MILLKRTLVAVLMLVALSASAQEQWSLQKCIDYALENNITVKQQQLNTNYYDNQLKQARNNRLPSVSGSVSDNYSYGRSERDDGTIVSSDDNRVSASLSGSMNLWSGFRVNNSVSQAEFTYQARLADLEKAKDDLQLNIAAAYLEILFADELIQVSKDQIGVTTLQVGRTEKLVEAGSLAKGSLLEIEAQLASEELTLVEAENQQQLAYLNLFQMLELPSTESFRIEKPVLPVVTANRSVINSMDVFKTAVEQRPEIRAAQYDLKASEKGVSVAKGDLYPSLSLGGNYSSFQLHSLDGSFGQQFKDHQGSSLYLSLDIPIFNRLQARTNINNAQLDVMSKELELQNTKNSLRKEIETAYTNAVAALKKYMASSKAVESMQESFRYTEEKFNVGIVNSVEYNQAKNNLTKAQSDLAQAKYDYIFRTKILDFYNGIPITL